ncbi:hypothetical protein TWF225_009327 [Orbilia oligospora]|nr:hypothetical protein TWF225_009327 [Orbilia oligospora]KAF3269965.1 hypothetical protein TWF217_008311 [Orbilia oligospora]KAF3270428.1 hypothetical protein TWF128_004203 [Orbilia oligospora]KAF3298084.1 hypothetical protein TWF132_004222 [Orbilia oligospora]
MPFSKYLFSLRKFKHKTPCPFTSEPTTVDPISRLRMPSMPPRTTLLDLPNELLVPILADVVAVIKPQETIRSGIVQLSWTCRRFHQVMQYFLESTCYVGVSIPVRQPVPGTTAPITVGKPVNISYRLLKHNTKGARGPFVKKLDIYGGFRKTYTEYQDSQNRLSNTSTSSRDSRDALESELDLSTKMLNTVYEDLIKGFQNLTIASLQNTPESLFIHLIPGLQTILEHCPLLAELKLLFIISQEGGGYLESVYRALPDNNSTTAANLKALDISIIEENPPLWKVVSDDSDDSTRSRIYPFEILGRVFGTSIASVRTFKVDYIVNGIGLYSSETTDPPEKWNMPALKTLQFPVLSETTHRFLTELCEIDYARIEELTLNGTTLGNLDPDNPNNLPVRNAVALVRQCSGLKLLEIEALSARNLPWINFVLNLDIPSVFPVLRHLQVRIKSYFQRELTSLQMTSLQGSLETFALKHGNEIRRIWKHEGTLNAEEIYLFSIL